MEINVLSLFDGIACGYEALIKAGIKVNKYYASEIDTNAIKIAKKNHPDIIELGDINNIDFTQFIGKIDLIMGGSPCQDLSIAGNRKGLSGDRSGLFYKFIEALEVIKPKYFLLENNVGMPKEAYEEISRLMGCYPIEINSALVSAQTRKRYYWTNIGPQNFNLFGMPTVAIPQPKDKKIVLKDILESGIAPQNKSFCLTETYYKGTFSDMVKKHTRTMVAEPFIISLPHGYNNGAIKEQKAPTITSSKYEYNNLIAEPIRIGHIGATAAQANRVYSVNAKSVCLNANGGGGGAKTGLYKIDLPDGKYFIRKLTPIECERLQTLPDNYTEGISNSNRYKVLGNGWTVDVIAHIFSYLKEEPTWNYDNIKKTI
jgi:DNA (cytosine-5)-methyltransferase 3A